MTVRTKTLYSHVGFQIIFIRADAVAGTDSAWLMAQSQISKSSFNCASVSSGSFTVWPTVLGSVKIS